MSGDAEQVRKLLCQQVAIARFGSFALRQSDLHTILSEAARVCAEGLSVPFSKICRYRAEDNDLLVEAGFGWQQGVVGHVISRADSSTPQGRAFTTGLPAVCNDLRQDNHFELPPFYAAHGIVSTIDVIIKGSDQPYGILEIDSDTQHNYDQHDIDFLTAFANVLAEAVATSTRTALLSAAMQRMTNLIQEKDRLLVEKQVLAEELQHRVRNNLQLVYGMLTKQLSDTADIANQKGIRSIARRVSTLAQVYDHLLGNGMTRTTDFGVYVKSLCLNLADVQATPEGHVTLTCHSETLMLDLDVVTALSIIVTELVTNSYEHAFSEKEGSISVSVLRSEGLDAMAHMTISDNGRGFVAKAGSKRHGLGLVRRLVEQIYGTVDVLSANGTTWTIKFPTGVAIAPPDVPRLAAE